jgi:hypothetical protein
VEIVRRAHDELFLERLRDEADELLPLFLDPDRLFDDREPFRAEADFDPLDRVEPRFEPRFVWRELRFREPPGAPSPALPPACCDACVASPVTCPACPAAWPTCSPA